MNSKQDFKILCACLSLKRLFDTSKIKSTHSFRFLNHKGLSSWGAKTDRAALQSSDDVSFSYWLLSWSCVLLFSCPWKSEISSNPYQLILIGRSRFLFVELSRAFVLCAWYYRSKAMWDILENYLRHGCLVKHFSKIFISAKDCTLAAEAVWDVFAFSDISESNTVRCPWSYIQAIN